MEIGTLNKMGKVCCAKELTCIVFSVEQSVFISSVHVSWIKCCQKFGKNIPHQQRCIKKQRTEQSCVS
jgi:hypothetical protein